LRDEWNCCFGDREMTVLTKVRRHLRSICLVLAGLSGLMAVDASADPLAKEVFGAQRLPAATMASVHGTYSKGCFAGGMAIAEDGPNWQAMRLSRNRRWGHPEMIATLERLSREAVQDGWPGLLLGDISQPRGGPMTSGHASHQLGLDADIWFVPMPANGRLSAKQRESMDFVSMLKPNSLQVDNRKWTPAHEALLKRAASYRNVERVLVHPGIKKKLCDTVTGDRSWLGKVRPIWGHDAHFHVRIGCPAGSPGCKPQEAVGRGDGCDSSLAWWFTDEPWRPATGPAKPRARDVMRLSALPAACKAVLSAPEPTSIAAVTVTGAAGAIVANTGVPPVAASAYAPTPERAIPMPLPRPSQ
jgi:penicillin-insensitive murein endopeptidase